MASLGALAVVQTQSLTFATGKTAAGIATGGFGPGLLGFALIAAAGFIDSRFIIPGILGKPNQAQPQRLIDLPTMTVAPGSPMIWALGTRIRMPVHVMFQSDKVHEGHTAGKTSPTGSLRRVTSDIALILNARPTRNISQLIGSGKLLIFRSRNLVTLDSDAMVASVSGGRLRITAGSLQDPEFTGFAVDDRILLSGWLANGGPDINIGYWKVNSVTGHVGATPSRIDLDIYGGQALAGLAATAGTSATPARLTRVDDAFVDHTPSVTAYAPGGGAQIGLTLTGSVLGAAGISRIFQSGDHVRLKGFTPAGINDVELILSNIFAGFFTVSSNDPNFVWPAGPYTAGTSTNAGYILAWLSSTFTPGTFAADPLLTFHDGSATQGEDAVISQTEATNTIPGFRGACYIALDDFDLSPFGNNLPLMEAVLEPDDNMQWADAIKAICERSGVLGGEVDTAGVDALGFGGYYIRGTTPGVQALQPIMVAGQIATQERDPVLAFFQIENADVVQIENGASFSDLGTTAGTDTPLRSDKLLFGQLDESDLPTAIGVKHQDIDNFYADGYQRFGLRNPSGNEAENQQELDLSQLALTRKQAANLAITTMRRTWVNANTVEMSLPCAYLEVLENDLLTVTDDNGNDVLCRVIRVDVGTNYLVNISAVREHLSLAVHGSPVQSNAGTTVPPPINVPTLRTQFLDMAPYIAADMRRPGIYVTTCAEPGGHWAGAALFQSRDAGTNWTRVASINQEGCIGVTTSALGTTTTIGETLLTGAPFFDEANSVFVSMSSLGVLGLSTVSDQALLGGMNWCRIGDEILAFGIAELQGDGTYKLSHLLRGLRGTYGSCSIAKAIGSNFTLITALPDVGGVLIPVDFSQGQPAPLKFRMVPTGATIADVLDIDVIVEGRNARPFPVRDITKTINGSNDARFTFRHWSRDIFPLGFKGPWPLDETFEGYELRIYDPAGGTLKRTKRKPSIGGSPNGTPTLRDPWLDYTAQEQTDDGYTPSSSTQFWIEVAQQGDFGLGILNKQFL